MSDADLAVWFAEFVIAGSIVLIIYIVYHEYKTAKINEQNSRIKLGERENEDYVNSLSDQQLVDLANKSESGLPSAPAALDSTDPKKPGSGV